MTKIKLKPVLREAWAKVKGVKKYFFVTLLALMLLQLVFFTIQILSEKHLPQAAWVGVVSNMLLVLLTSPFMAGFMILGIKRARDEVLTYRSALSWFNFKMLLKLFGVEVMILLTTWAVLYVVFILVSGLLGVSLHTDSFAINIIAAILGTLFILVFLSLQCLFSFAFIILIEENQSPWKAYQRSIVMAWPYLGVLIRAEIVCLFFEFIGLIFFGIGLLWTVPFSFIVTGIFYREISNRITNK